MYFIIIILLAQFFYCWCGFRIQLLITAKPVYPGIEKGESTLHCIYTDLCHNYNLASMFHEAKQCANCANI